MTSSWPTLSRRAGFLLFLASLLVYNLNLREISAQDTIPTRILPVALIEEHRLNVDRLFRQYPAGAALPFWVRRVGDHYLSAYPILPALMAVPVYFLPVTLFGIGSWAEVNLLAKLSATVFAGLSVWVMYLGLRRLTSESGAIGIALVYAFATSTWSVSSQGLWGHGPGQLFMGAAVYCTLRGDADRRYFHATGAATGLMVASRPQTALIGAALVAYVLHRDREHGLRSLLWAGATALPFLLYNLWNLGSVLGGYGDFTTLRAEVDRAGWGWLAATGEGLLGLLLSPSRGLFVYSPVLAFGVVGLVHACRDPRSSLLRYLAAGLGASLLMLGSYASWWGGHSFGPRYLTDLLPSLVLFLVPAWERLERVQPARAMFAVLFAVSVSIQVIGAFYYPSARDQDWNKVPRDVDVAPDRLWDWRDIQILRLLRNGPRPLGFDSIG